MSRLAMTMRYDLQMDDNPFNQWRMTNESFTPQNDETSTGRIGIISSFFAGWEMGEAAKRDTIPWFIC